LHHHSEDDPGQHMDVNDGMIISIANTQSTNPKDSLNYSIQLQMQVITAAITFLVWTAKYQYTENKLD
jgi:hypothetical protein